MLRTKTGGCLSLLVMLITLLFAILKFEHLITNKNPSVTEFIEEDALDSASSDGAFDLRQNNF